MTLYLFPPPAIRSLPIRGQAQRFPLNRIFCVGRNYHAHALEMGLPVDKRGDAPFYFLKSTHALVESGATVPYPPRTSNFHHEIELVVAIGRPGFRLPQERAHELIYGYAAGLDMTRRDLQQAARDKGCPWDTSKNIEQGAVCSEIVPMEGIVVDRGAIALEVNGVTRQSSDVAKMIWSVPQIIADLSTYYHLEPGDLIYTGTPEGVGAVLPGDRITGRVEGIAEVVLTIGTPA